MAAPRQNMIINLCQECGKTFKHHRSLKRHENRHKGRMPYHCCGKSFDDHTQFVRHRQESQGLTRGGETGSQWVNNPYGMAAEPQVVKQNSGSRSIARPASHTEGSWSQIEAARMEYGLHTLHHKIRHRRSKRRAERNLFMVFSSMQASMLCSLCRQKRNRRCVRRHCTRASTSRS